MKFYVFYTYAYGMHPQQRVFEKKEELLAFIQEAMDDISAYRDLTVIYGKKLEFEPAVVIQSYKIKD